MKKHRTRILSLLLAVIMLASLLPVDSVWQITRADDSPYNLTIDFDYAKREGVTTPTDALRVMGDQHRHYENTDEDFWKSTYNNYHWQHADHWTSNTPEDGSIRKLLTSTDPADKYISLLGSDHHEHHGRGPWVPMKITTDKVLDLNGYSMEIQFNRNRNNSESNKYQNPFPDVLNCVAFEIENGATLTIIDSSAWRGEGKDGKGTGSLSFTAYMIDPYKYDINYYTTRDMFWVNNGNLVIYGGTFQAGRKKDQFKSNFSWSKLKTVIGQTVELGVSVASYATGLDVATSKYTDLLNTTLNKTALKENGNTGEDDGTEGPTQTTIPRDGTNLDPKKDTKKDTPDKAGAGDQTIGEKKDEKDKNIDGGKEGTKEGTNKENDKKTGKDDTQTKLAEERKNVVNQAVNKSGIMGMVDSAFSLVEGICGLFGSDPKTRITNMILGTVVHVGNQGSFVSYGGTFKGYGNTPNTRNGVVEVTAIPGTTKVFDHSKTKGGMAYIYGGTYEAYAGANIFNITRYNENQFAMQYSQDEYGRRTGPTKVPLTLQETAGVEVLYYNNQSEIAADTTGKVVPVPVDTGNIQVRGGLFRCFYDVMYLSVKGDSDEHFTKFPGTVGSVNLGIESFNEDLIQDGRIQIIDKYGDGALVLLDERKDEEVKQDGLYHYRLFCGENELRVKSYLEVYPNTAKTNTSHSMQLATYVGTGKRTASIFVDDEDNDRAPYRQTENYFDYMIDATNAANYSVMPNFHFNETDSQQAKMDVYGESLANSEIWYYNTPLTADGDPIADIPYGYAQFTATNKDQSGGLYCNQQLFSDKDWKNVLKRADPSTVKYTVQYNDRICNNLKYFTYRVYRVDPLTRENISESCSFGEDMPLLEVCYGASTDSLKCKLPLKDVEARIIQKRGYGYQPGEMFRIILDVEEYVACGYRGGGLYGQTLPAAKSESSILFRCFSSQETKDTNEVYKAHDFTPLQWNSDPYHGKVFDIEPGKYAKIELINGKAGMTDFRGDCQVFDLYYQWWEVTADGTPIRLIAGTDNIYDPSMGDRDDHRPETWNVGKDGKTYVNTVSPTDPLASTYGDNGLPKDKLEWTNTQLHMYATGTTPINELTKDGTSNLHLGNNDIFKHNSDRCYIPMEMEGKYLRVKVVALNVGWPDAFDSRQTFWSHIVKLPEQPLEPLTGELGIKFNGANYATAEKPATLSLDGVTNLGVNETITYVYYSVGGRGVSFDKLNVKDPKDLPTVSYPNDFYETQKQIDKMSPYPREGYAYFRTSKGRNFTTTKESFNFEVEAKSTSVWAEGEIGKIRFTDTQGGDNLTGYYNVVLNTISGDSRIFLPEPYNATVGWSCKDATSTNPGVATVDERGYVQYGGKTGETTISVKGPDGKTVSKTVQVYNYFTHVDISGISAPVIGETFDYTAEVPADAPYHVTKVEWARGSTGLRGYGSYEDVTESSVAEYWQPYTVYVTIAPDDFTEFHESESSLTFTVDNADGSQSVKNWKGWSNQDFDEEIYDYVNTYTYSYTFPATGKYEASKITEIHVDFPVEVAEGSNVTEWFHNMQVTTNGHDEDLDIQLTPTYSANTYSLLPVYNCSGLGLNDANEPSINTFIQGVQTGISARISILGPDAFADKGELAIYINGEQCAHITALYDDDIWFEAADTLTVTEGKLAPVMPSAAYGLKPINLVLNEPVDLEDVLATSDDRFSIDFAYIYLGSYEASDYFTYDDSSKTLTPIQPLPSFQPTATVYVYVSFDADGDGVYEYRDLHSIAYDQEVYASASEAPDLSSGGSTTAPTVYDYRILDPKGALIEEGKYQGDSDTIPVPDDLIIASIDKTGATHEVTTVYAKDLEIHAGANVAYAFLKNSDGTDVDDLQLSVDGLHYARTDNVAGLTPSTEYVLYYRRGNEGHIFTKVFTTAGKNYGVTVARTPVTELNAGNLEKDGWSYDPDTKTLTLKDCTIVDSGSTAEVGSFSSFSYTDESVITSGSDLTVLLLGNNTIHRLKSRSNSAMFEFVIFAKGDLHITGTGNLTIEGESGIGQSVYSKEGSIYLEGSGTQTYTRGSAFDTGEDSEKIYYINGTIDFIPPMRGSGDTTYQGGSLCFDSNQLDLSRATHSLSISMAGRDGVLIPMTESEMRDQYETNRTTSNFDHFREEIHIVPNHSDVNKVTTEAYFVSGDCETGSTYYYSCDCGHIGAETFTTAAAGHSLVHHEAKPATCTEDGWLAYDTCANCSYTTFQVQPALGHDWTHHDALEPTCTANGHPAYDECSRCGLSSEAEIPAGTDAASWEGVDADLLQWKALGHELKKVSGVPATCTEDGTVDHYECVRCGEKYLDEAGTTKAGADDLVAPALGHSWGEWTNSGDGKETRTCALCGEVETRDAASPEPTPDPGPEPTPEPTPEENPFEDLNTTDYYYDAVLWAYNAEPQVTNGMDATHFGPANTVTRGQAVTFLWRAMGCPEPTSTTNPFEDVTESKYFYKPVLWAVEKGITNGTDATHFTPNQTCSTAHIITFLYRTMGIGTNGWGKESEEWARASGLLDGLDVTVAPGVDCPRSDVVLYLYRELAAKP